MAFLLLLLACRRDLPAVAGRDGGFSALGRYPDLDRDLRAYAEGRAAEVRALEGWPRRAGIPESAALDSIGAAAVNLGADRYGRLTAEVDRALIRWQEDGKLDQRLRSLDSLRVARKVLLVRLTISDTGSNR